MDQWLVRTSDNWITGPFSADHVRQMILDGKLSHQDEVCDANSYWIFLHEREEILKSLGVEVPLISARNEEDQTETETLAEIEDPTHPGDSSGNAGGADGETTFLKTSHTPEHVSVHLSGHSAGHLSGLPSGHSPESQAGQVLGRAQPLSVESKTDPSVREKNLTPSVHSVGSAQEKTSFWRTVAWILVISAVALIVFLSQALVR